MAGFHGLPCWYELASADCDRAQAFYSAVLGWTWADSGMPCMTYMIGKADNAMVAGVMPAMPGQPVAWSIYFAVND